MPIDDDPIDIVLRQIRQEIETDVERDMGAATLAGTLSLIPGIGSAIQSLLENKARRNIERRWVQLFADLKQKVEEFRDDIPDDRYYESEEFQTILALAYQELLTTHDREKLRLLANSLANSGRHTFINEDKEQLVRTLRDLSTRDIATLAVLKPRRPEWMTAQPDWMPTPRPKWENPMDEDLGSLSRLVALGLAVEHLEVESPPRGGSGSERIDAQNHLEYALTPRIPNRVFQISPYGIRFIAFTQNENDQTNEIT